MHICRHIWTQSSPTAAASDSPAPRHFLSTCEAAQHKLSLHFNSIFFPPNTSGSSFFLQMIPLQIHTFHSMSQIQMFPDSLKLSSQPGNATGFSSTETVNAARPHPGHLCLVETGDKVEPSNGKSQSQEPCQLLGRGRGGKQDTALCSKLLLLPAV